MHKGPVLYQYISFFSFYARFTVKISNKMTTNIFLNLYLHHLHFLFNGNTCILLLQQLLIYMLSWILHHQLLCTCNDNGKGALVNDYNYYAAIYKIKYCKTQYLSNIVHTIMILNTL